MYNKKSVNIEEKKLENLNLFNLIILKIIYLVLNDLSIIVSIIIDN